MMKYKASRDINQHLNKVAEVFTDPENLKEYQGGFIKKEFAEKQ